LTLLFVSCKNRIDEPVIISNSDFSLLSDYSEFTTKMSEIDTIKVLTNLSLCTYLAKEQLIITRRGDSIEIQSEFAESFKVDSEFKVANYIVISIKDTTWKFNEFLKRNENRIITDSVRNVRLQITLNNDILHFVTNGLSESGRFLSDYCITMMNLFPDSESYIYGVEMAPRPIPENLNITE